MCVHRCASCPCSYSSTSDTLNIFTSAHRTTLVCTHIGTYSPPANSTTSTRRRQLHGLRTRGLWLLMFSSLFLPLLEWPTRPITRTPYRGMLRRYDDTVRHQRYSLLPGNLSGFPILAADASGLPIVRWVNRPAFAKSDDGGGLRGQHVTRATTQPSSSTTTVVTTRKPS